MALDTRIGSATGNSFITIVRCAELLPVMFESADVAVWTALETWQKEMFLTAATDFLSYFRFKRPGKVYRTQALSWPRKCQTEYGYALHHIPIEVEKATAYLAFGVFYRAWKNRESVDEDVTSEDISSFSVSGLSIKFGATAGFGGQSIETFVKTEHWYLYTLLRKFLAPIRGETLSDYPKSTDFSTTSTTTTT